MIWERRHMEGMHCLCNRCDAWNEEGNGKQKILMLDDWLMTERWKWKTQCDQTQIQMICELLKVLLTWLQRSPCHLFKHQDYTLRVWMAEFQTWILLNSLNLCPSKDFLRKIRVQNFGMEILFRTLNFPILLKLFARTSVHVFVQRHTPTPPHPSCLKNIK